MIILRFIFCVILIINLCLFSIQFKLNNEEKNLEEFDYEYQVVRAKRDAQSHKSKTGNKSTESPKKKKNKTKKNKKKEDKKKKDKKKKNKTKKPKTSTTTTTSTLPTTTPLITTTTMNTTTATEISTSTTTATPIKYSPTRFFFEALFWKLRLLMGLGREPKPREPYYLPQDTTL